jgi:hypothetical protein
MERTMASQINTNITDTNTLGIGAPGINTPTATFDAANSIAASPTPARAAARWDTRCGWIWGGLAGLGLVVVASVATVPTTVRDFFMPGSQPGEIAETLVDAFNCRICHGDYAENHDLANAWSASMMAQSARDPKFWACLTIANQDSAFVGEACIRCHVPVGWYSGRSSPPDGSALTGYDFDGVSCIVCHRMVDPDYKPGISPPEDEAILAGLAHPPPTALPAAPGNTNAVIDPLDRRRGPIIVAAEFHRWLQSPFHQKSQMCATCHEVSNPALSRQPDGSYILNPVNEEHPTGNKYDMFPLDRTYSEWSQSAFAQGPINMAGRFGGTKLEVSSCQDCHMPETEGYVANQFLGAIFRTNVNQHFFMGGNTWVLQAVRNLYNDSDTGLTRDRVSEAITRTKEFLAAASDMELSRAPAAPGVRELNVRVINQGGHKLPTGYHEGRRMWINVRFLDAVGNVIAERGAYDPATASLSTADTKVYEAKQGLDAYMSGLTGKPIGESFHQVLNNKIYKDNRIPPRGFTNAGFASVQAAPVNYTYADGQHWDDTRFTFPINARRAEVKVFFQTTSRDYIEFLRDMNTTNTLGQIAYDQWVATGKSEPALMDSATIVLCPADFNNDGTTDFFDYLDFVSAFDAEDPSADFNGDLQVDFFDYLDFVSAFAEEC